MAKAKAKTVETEASVKDFISTVEDPVKQMDCKKIVKLMSEVSGFKPKMWGPAIIGFGSYHFKYESGHEGDAPRLGFSPRKNALSLYLCLNASDREKLLKVFGKYKTAKSCIYVKKLDDINIDVLKEMIKVSIERMNQKYP